MDAVLRAIFGADGSAPVMIDLSDSVQPNQKFEVNLTEHQRKSLIEFCNLGKWLRCSSIPTRREVVGGSRGYSGSASAAGVGNVQTHCVSDLVGF
jgi:hypothetical protein